VAAGRIPVSVIIIGAAAGIDGVPVPAGSRWRFDGGTDSWRVTPPDGEPLTATVVIDARPSADDTLAVHGMPNFFRIPGPDTIAQSAAVQRCLDLLTRSGAARIEARGRIRHRRFTLRPLSTRFYLTGSVPGEDELYDGPATLNLSDGEVPVRARLTGHLAAIDGRYHWRGTVRGEFPEDMLRSRRAVTVSIGNRCASARVTEKTPWGGYTITGVGVPPFDRD